MIVSKHTFESRRMSRAFASERIVEEDEVVVPESEESVVDSKKVFINNVNSYHGNHIARVGLLIQIQS